MSKKGTNTTQSFSAPNPQAMSAYQDVIQRATAASNKPYTPYGGETVAPINAQQMTGVGAINQYAGAAQPYITNAGIQMTAAGTPVNASDIARYMDPYTGQVIDATQADFAHQNERANAAVIGNAAAAGALGGDRVGVAQALTQESQTRAQSPIIAGLRSAGFNAAMTAAQNDKNRQMQSAAGLANVGVAGQTAGLAGGEAQIGAGTLQQQTQQAQDTASMQEYFRQQGYDFQTAQWLAGIVTATGSQMGGTSSTQGPEPNQWSQLAGLGMTAASMFLKDGGAVDRARGGANAPWAGVEGWIPAVTGLTMGRGAPAPPQLPKESTTMGGDAMGKGLANIGKKAYGWATAPSAPISLAPDGIAYAPAGVGSYSPIGSAPQGGFGHGPFYNSGGVVRNYADAGAVEDPYGGRVMAGFGMGSVVPSSFDERFTFPASSGPNMDAGRVDNYNALQTAGTASVPDYEREGVNPGLLASPASLTLPRERPMEAPPRGMEPPIEIASSGVSAPIRADDVLPAGGLSEPIISPTTPAKEAAADRGLFGVLNMSPELRRGILQAGLGMMAARHGGPGSFLANAGEAGMRGVAGYDKVVQERVATEQQETEDTRKNRQLNIQEAHYAQLAKQAMASLAETRRHRELLERDSKEKLDIMRQQPIDLGSVAGPYGSEKKVKGLRMPDGSIKVINPESGQLESQGSTPAPAPPPRPLGMPDDVPSPPPIERTAANEDDGLPPNAQLVSSKPPSWANPQALEGMSEEDKRKVVAIAEGRLRFPSLARRNPYNQYLVGKVLEYDPTASETTYPRRQRTENFFAVGTQGGGGQNIAAMNTWAQHMGHYLDVMKKMGNTDFTSLNDFYNWASSKGYTNKQAQDMLKEAEIAAKAVADEGAKVFAGSQSALADREEWGKMFRPNVPYHTAFSAAKSATKLVEGRLAALSEQYSEGTRTDNTPYRLIKGKTRATMDSILNASKPEDYVPPGDSAAKGEGGRDKVPEGSIPGTRKDGTKVWKLPDGKIIPRTE